MNHERVKTLIDCYGADTQRWPVEERADAVAVLMSSSELMAYRAEAASLDKILHTNGSDEDYSALADRILADLPRQKPERNHKSPFVFALAASVALVFVTTLMMKPELTETPLSGTQDIAQTEFDQWAMEETFDQTPIAMNNSDEVPVEWPFMEI